MASDPSQIAPEDFQQLNQDIEYIEDHDEHADIAAGDKIIDESLGDEESQSPDADAKAAEAETRASEPTVNSVLHSYLLAVHKRLRQEESQHGKPQCYLRGDFFDRPPHPVFALERSKDTVGLDPTQIYFRKVFVWLPYLLPGHPTTFKCTCSKHLVKNGIDSSKFPSSTDLSLFRFQ